MKRIWAIFASLVLTFQLSYAQYFRHLTVRDGLSDNYVFHIEKDGKGNMWFATSSGLDMFDGHEFTKFTGSDGKLHYESISYVAEDHGGNIWVKSDINGYLLADRNSNTLSKDFSAVFNLLEIDEIPVSLISVDRDGNLWLQGNGQLYFHDYSENTTEIFEINTSVTSIASSGQYSFIATGDGGILQLKPYRKDIGENLKTKSPVSLFLDRKGSLWAYGSRICIYDGIDNSWKDISGQVYDGRDYFTSMTDDDSGNLWLTSTSDGVLMFSRDYRDVRHIEKDLEDVASLTSNHTNDLLIDNDNTIWIATAKKGVAYSSLDYMDINRTSTSIPEDVGTIIEDRNGTIWLGYDGKGLKRLKDNNIESTNLESQNIVGSFLDSDGLLYFTSYGDGVKVWDGKTSHDLKVPDRKCADLIRTSRDIFRDHNGNLWISTFHNGVVCIKNDGTYQQFTTDNSALSSNGVMSMAYDPKENLVYVGSGESLCRISVISSESSKILSLPHFTTLFCGENGIVWIGTADGLYYCDGKRGGKFGKITETDGLSDKYIQGMCLDKFGNLWVSTNNGFTNIFIYNDPNAEEIVTRCYPFHYADELTGSQFTKNTVFCTSDGTILMGCDGDLISVKPDRYAPNSQKPNFSITAVEVSGDIIPQERYCPGNNLKIKFYDAVSIHMSSRNYRNPKGARYEYRIDNDEHWSSLNDNILKISRLSPGKHYVNLRVSGYSADTVSEESLCIQVAPPFFKSVPAYILYLLLAIVLIYGIITYYRNSADKKVALEHMEMDKAKLQFFTNISHDLRTPLTMILTPLSRLIRESKGQDIEEDLVLMQKSAKTLMDEINQLLEFRKLGNDDNKINLTYGDICLFISEVSSSFSSVFSDSDISIRTEMCESSIMMDFDRNKIQRILRNLLSNAYKYNTPGGSITLSISREGDNAIIRVADTGIGISDEDKKHIFDCFYQVNSGKSSTGSGIGLNIVHEYVKLLNGTVSVADNVPHGTVFTVTLPITDATRDSITLNSNTLEQNNPEIPSVLVVEDNENFRAFLCRSLSRDYKVSEARNGRIALEKMAEANFDIVISDVLMPEMDGVELCRTIKNDINLSHTPVVLLTAIQDEDKMLGMLKEGADEYISKPFDMELLTLKIEKLLNWAKESRKKWNSPTPTQTSEMKLSRLDRELMEKITSIAEKNLANSDFSIENFSSELGISRSGLYKKLVYITGKSPIEFIRMMRMKKAVEMLAEGETSVSQIAWKIGFSPKQFTRYFKEEFGCTPSEYIRRE